MFWTEKKLEARVKELATYRYEQIQNLEVLDFQEDVDGRVGAKPPQGGNWNTIRVGDFWTGRDTYIWLRKQVIIPANWKGKKVVGLFNFGRTGGGHNSGFESLLYVNGEPFQGVDTNHEEVFFKEEHIGTNVDLTFRLWSGLEGLEGRGRAPYEHDHKIQQAQLAILHEATDDLYFTSKAVLQTLTVLSEHSPEHKQLLQAVNKTYQFIDWSYPGSDRFYQSVEEARTFLSDALEQIGKQHPIVIRTIGHTHIDVAWLWRLKHTREKAARSFSTVLRLMEMYPEYIFLQSQPQLYEYIKQDYPELYEKIKARIQEGRWEAEGAMWLEPDCNIPAGESFVRQLLHGTRFLKQEFIVDSKYLWLPDVFGYSWALPQILKKSGIETFMTTKISWNQYNRMPHDTFKWRGMDGTEILTHFITTPIPGNKGWQYTYNGELLAETVQGIWDVYRDKDLTNELLISYGYGDGGGGVNREMLEMRRRLDQMPGLPHVKTGKAGAFFDQLHEQIKSTDHYVHTWDGELYLEYHRGTYTSQAYNKKMNRKLELAFRKVELLGSLTSLVKQNWSHYPTENLFNAWKILLRNQFHDIIPGSSIQEVYEDSREELSEAESLANEAIETIQHEFINKESVYTILNDASWKRKGLVMLPEQKGSGVWVDASGDVLQAAKTKDGWMVSLEDVPSVGVTTIRYKESEETPSTSSPFHIGSSSIRTPFYDIEWNEQGQLSKLWDVKAKRSVLKEKETANQLQVFEDKPMFWDAWDIDVFYQEKQRTVNQLNSVEIIEENGLRAIIRFEWTYLQSIITQDMIVYADSRRIDFQTCVDWQETNQLLKVAFPVDVRSTEATYDIQFGNVKRPTHWNTSWDFAKFETAAHQWADLSEKGYGVSLLNDSKYGYDIKDYVMRLTLLKSAQFPDRTQDQGKHTFTYSLLPHQGDWIDGQTVQEAWDLNQPLQPLEGQLLDSPASLFELSKDHVLIDAVKKAEDSNQLVVRLHEFTGERGEVELRSNFAINQWQESDLMEKEVGEKQATESIRFFIKPYEIKTFLIDLTK
ncbi:alpha-mannosidase [Radiobacillus deserti]|uniref:Alpha-mannosidase n=1 Tax=Radiobacillus deserti TaxID=2594883 RepID=A0A516KKS6_9BACI|nr:alpha-mannosidase [Radiobacillus deserti]QDP41997.1 alpha-mannosidase [Radiobacillus deserti]